MAVTVEIGIPDNNTRFRVLQLIDGEWVERYSCTATGGYYRGQWLHGERIMVEYEPFPGERHEDIGIVSEDQPGVVWQ